MHRVVKSHLDDFIEKFSVNLPDSRAFEAFVAYSAFRKLSADNIDPKDLIYEGDDPGIDGLSIFLDDSYVSSVDEVAEFFASRKRDVDAVIIFTQTKTSESWDKKEINTFQSAITDFLSDEQHYPHSDFMKNAREVFDAVIKNVGKLRGGKPRTVCYFATTAKKSTDREIIAAIRSLNKSVKETGLFSQTEASLLDRDLVVELWTSAEGQVEATLPILGSAAFPKAPEIEQGYVLTVRAKDFIQFILSDASGRLRQRIFDENVRDFIGETNEINVEISETLKDAVKQKRFGLLNNGITIISPDIRLTSFEIFMRDFQIVNGCQTSNVLFENRELIGDDITVMLKIVETSDASVVDDIVRSTNRQTKVEDDQFLATLDVIKSLERYFEARGQDEESPLYFERRKNQYSSHADAKAIRVFDIKEIARCVAALFLDKPDVASRYPNRLTGEMRSLVFSPEYAEELFHVSAYALYRLKLLFSNQRLDGRYGKLRWHILMAVKYFVLGAKTPQLNSNKMAAACQKIREFMSAIDENSLEQLKALCSEIFEVETITRDMIKTPSFTVDVRDKALAFRARTDR